MARLAWLAGAIGAAGAVGTPRFAKLNRVTGFIYGAAAWAVWSPWAIWSPWATGAMWTGAIRAGGVGAVDSST